MADTTPTSFWYSGITRVLTSSKVTAAVPTVVSAYFVVRSVTADMTPNARAAVWSAFIVAVHGALGAIVWAWGHEDAAQKTGLDASGNPLPTQTNTTLVSTPAAATVQSTSTPPTPLQSPTSPLTSLTMAPTGTTSTADEADPPFVPAGAVNELHQLADGNLVWGRLITVKPHSALSATPETPPTPTAKSASPAPQVQPTT